MCASLLLSRSTPEDGGGVGGGGVILIRSQIGKRNQIHEFKHAFTKYRITL